MPDHEPASVWRFGPFTFDARSGELRRDGVHVMVPHQPLVVLRHLVENHGRIVDRTDLQQRVWGDRIVEYDQGINHCIRQIRQSLGDSASHPTYVETVPRRGYRFVAEVGLVDPSTLSGSSPVLDSASSRWSGRRLGLAMAVGVVGIALVSFGMIRTGLPSIEATSVPASTVFGSRGADADSFSASVETSSLIFDGPWVVQAGQGFGHDGAIIESEHVILYSDFSAPAVRESLLLLIEDAYDDLTRRLQVRHDRELDFPPGGRIHVYSDKYQADPAYGYASVVNGWAFRDGFVVMAADAPRYARGGYYPNRYRRLVIHEVMHSMEFMLVGRDAPVHSTMVWFREGVATYMAGLAPGGIPINDVTNEDLHQWRHRHETWPPYGNPIAIESFGDLPSMGLPSSAWYVWFAQVIRYVVEPEGLGLGEEALRSVYDGIRAGAPFEEAFAATMGITVAQLRDEFYATMEDFLP